MNIKRIKIRRWVKVLFFLILIISSITLYSRYFGTKGFTVKEYGVVDSNLPNNFYGLKIVQLSDIHYKVTTTKEDLEKLVKEINLLKPDIVILTGDLFDSNIKYSKKDFKDLKKILKKIDYNIDKYAIKGEDDLNIDNWEEVINNSNFINLNDNYEFIYNNGNEPILLVGINSNYKKKHIKNTLNSIYEEINTKYKYSILIVHEPDIINSIDYSKFNLILAGHSHGGQVKIPFIGGIIKDKYSKIYTDEFYKLENTKLYISSGIGTTKYKFRLFNKPSINFYRLRNK
ncbi:MAG: metallophosphoesterase [Bacilli bacterium]|nr:metallophosphoesterase [Bacilli bacterium]